jgi:GNAT superfamily N-acetyltransferase
VEKQNGSMTSIQPAKPPNAITEATSADAQALVSLCCQLGYPSTVEQISARLECMRQDPMRVLFISIDPQGRVVGFIDLDHRIITVCDGVVDICGLVIDESVRGQGYGDALLRHAEDWARARGVDEVSLRSNVIRTQAHGFYKRRGYEIYKQSYAFRKKLSKRPSEENETEADRRNAGPALEERI